jgi:hypothetical protein
VIASFAEQLRSHRAAFRRRCRTLVAKTLSQYDELTQQVNATFSPQWFVVRKLLDDLHKVMRILAIEIIKFSIYNYIFSEKNDNMMKCNKI